MKMTGAYKIWQILYPVGMYYVAGGIAFFFIQLFLGDAAETYMLRQTVSAAATIPVIFSYYAADKRIRDNVYGRRPVKFDRTLAGNIAAAAVITAALAAAVNNLIAMSPLMEASDSFAAVNDTFFAGRLLYELFGSCLVIPIAEELLFRGVVYQRLKLLFAQKVSAENPGGKADGDACAADARAKAGAAGISRAGWMAVCLSALLFGLVHFNLVQFVYAGGIGLVLALLYEKSGFLYVSVIGHIAANLIAVLRAETGVLAFSFEPTAAGIGVTAALLLLGAGGMGVYMRRKRAET